MNSIDTTLAALPQEQRQYILQSLAVHLAEADHQDRLRELLTTFSFLSAKVDELGIAALLADYNLASHPALPPIQAALRLGAHALVRDSSQLPGQLLGRLQSGHDSGLDHLLDAAIHDQRKPWLHPLAPSLLAPDQALQFNLISHTDSVRSLAVLPDGQRLVSASSDQTLRIWDLATGQLLQVIDAGAPLHAVTVTPDGRRIIAGAADGQIQIWSVLHGIQEMTLAGHQDIIRSLVMVSDQELLSASRDTTIKLWELATGRLRRTFQLHGDAVTGLGLLTRDGLVISASRDGTIQIWELHSGEVRHTVTEQGREWNALGINADHNIAVAGVGSPLSSIMGLVFERAINPLLVLDLHAGIAQRTLPGHIRSINAVAVAPDGATTISASDDQLLKLWDLESGQERATFAGHTDHVVAVTITPDGRRAISGSHDAIIKVWNLAGGTELSSVHQGAVNAIAVAPEAALAVSASDDQTLKVWDLHRFEVRATLTEHTETVLSVAVAPRRRLIFSGAADQTLRVWDIERGQVLGTLGDHDDWITAITVTADEQAVIVGSADATIQIWDIASGSLQQSLSGHTDWITTIVATSDGATVISGSQDETVRLWDRHTGRELHCCKLPAGVSTLALDPLDQYVIIACGDRGLYRLSMGHERTVSLLPYRSPVNAIAIVAGTDLAFFAGDDMAITLWNLANNHRIVQFTCDSPVLTCTIAADGRIVAGDQGGAVHLLSLEDFSGTVLAKQVASTSYSDRH